MHFPPLFWNKQNQFQFKKIEESKMLSFLSFLSWRIFLSFFDSAKLSKFDTWEFRNSVPNTKVGLTEAVI